MQPVVGFVVNASMPTETGPFHPLEMWARPTPGWPVRCIIVLACVATLVIIATAARVLWDIDGDASGLDPDWFQNALAEGIGAALAIALVPPTRTSRFLRFALLLPIVHVVAIGTAWHVLAPLAGRMHGLRELAPVAGELPIMWVIPAMATGYLALAAVVVRGRWRELVHATVMLALVNMLALGVWLPVIAAAWPTSWPMFSGGGEAELFLAVLAPPVLVAAAFTAIAIRRSATVRRWRRPIAVVAMLVLATAIVLRTDASPWEVVLYDNFVHVVGAAVVLSVLALLVLGSVTWWEYRRARGALLDDRQWLAGTIVGRGDVIGGFEITSWLRGPRTFVGPFSITTEAGELPVPAGTRLASALPAASSALHVGEAMTVLRGGDRVILGGYVAHGDGDPYRSCAMMQPGPSGIVVMPVSAERGGLSHVVLSSWRACVAYLVIVSAIAVPALVGSIGRDRAFATTAAAEQREAVSESFTDAICACPGDRTPTSWAPWPVWRYTHRVTDCELRVIEQWLERLNATGALDDSWRAYRSWKWQRGGRSRGRLWVCVYPGHGSQSGR